MNKTINTFSSRTEWHPAFVEAIQLELNKYRDILTFEPELQLTAQPLKIDVLVIKKCQEVKIEKNIGRIFRTYNVIEYKSPDDYLSIEDYDKTQVYSRFYAVNRGVRTKDMSVTLVSTRKPIKLLNYLTSETPYLVRLEQAGIYLVEGDTSPTQIIVSKELSEKVNLWLTNLNNRLTINKLRRVLSATSKLTKNTPVRAYINVLIEENTTTFKELKMGKKFDAVMKEMGFIDRWEAQGQARGQADAIIHILSRRLKQPSKS